jgi:putative flippase GtrA
MLGTDTGRKVLRYVGASVVNVAVGQVILAVTFGLFHWSARSAAILAAVVAAGPAYWLARRWVWGRSGRSHFAKEIVPFWALALLGLAVTTWAAGVGERAGEDMSRLGQTIVVMASVLAVSGAFWVFRYVVLNRVLFADGPAQR